MIVHLRVVHLLDACRSPGSREEVRRRRGLLAALADRSHPRRRGRALPGGQHRPAGRGRVGGASADGDLLRHRRPPAGRCRAHPASADGRGRRRVAPEGPGRVLRQVGGAAAARSRRPQGARRTAEHGVDADPGLGPAPGCRDHHAAHGAASGRPDRAGAGRGGRRPGDGAAAAVAGRQRGCGGCADVVAGDRGRARRRGRRPPRPRRRPAARPGAPGGGGLLEARPRARRDDVRSERRAPAGEEGEEGEGALGHDAGGRGGARAPARAGRPGAGTGHAGAAGRAGRRPQDAGRHPAAAQCLDDVQAAVLGRGRPARCAES